MLARALKKRMTSIQSWDDICRSKPMGHPLLNIKVCWYRIGIIGLVGKSKGTCFMDFSFPIRIVGEFWWFSGRLYIAISWWIATKNLHPSMRGNGPFLMANGPLKGLHIKPPTSYQFRQQICPEHLNIARVRLKITQKKSHGLESRKCFSHQSAHYLKGVNHPFFRET